MEQRILAEFLNAYSPLLKRKGLISRRTRITQVPFVTERSILPLEIKEFNLKRVGIRAVLGDLETELMEVIWAQKKEFTNRELLEILNRKRMKPLEVSTVNITMARLFKKGLVNRRLEAIRGGHHYLYRATMTKKAFVRSISIYILSHLRKCFGDKSFKEVVPLVSDLILDSGSEISDRSE